MSKLKNTDEARRILIEVRCQITEADEASNKNPGVIDWQDTALAAAEAISKALVLLLEEVSE